KRALLRGLRCQRFDELSRSGGLGFETGVRASSGGGADMVFAETKRCGRDGLSLPIRWRKGRPALRRPCAGGGEGRFRPPIHPAFAAPQSVWLDAPATRITPSYRRFLPLGASPTHCATRASAQRDSVLLGSIGA